jgi:hypothetical protein
MQGDTGCPPAGGLAGRNLDELKFSPRLGEVGILAARIVCQTCFVGVWIKRFAGLVHFAFETLEIFFDEDVERFAASNLLNMVKANGFPLAPLANEVYWYLHANGASSQRRTDRIDVGLGPEQIRKFRLGTEPHLFHDGPLRIEARNIGRTQAKTQ